MEDAHIAKPGITGGISMFAVFDGHGGKEVAQFCAKYMPGEFTSLLKKSPSVTEHTLKDVFHRMDSMLREEQYAERGAVR